MTLSNTLNQPVGIDLLVKTSNAEPSTWPWFTPHLETSLGAIYNFNDSNARISTQMNLVGIRWLGLGSYLGKSYLATMLFLSKWTVAGLFSVFATFVRSIKNTLTDLFLDQSLF